MKPEDEPASFVESLSFAICGLLIAVSTLAFLAHYVRSYREFARHRRNEP
jgi:hypothetical protein